jgi:hypothetical protein
VQQPASWKVKARQWRVGDRMMTEEIMVNIDSQSHLTFDYLLLTAAAAWLAGKGAVSPSHIAAKAEKVISCRTEPSGHLRSGFVRRRAFDDKLAPQVCLTGQTSPTADWCGQPYQPPPPRPFTWVPHTSGRLATLHNHDAHDVVIPPSHWKECPADAPIPRPIPQPWELCRTRPWWC